MGRIIYYLVAGIVGFVFSMIVLGSSLNTTFLLDGTPVNHRMTDASFLMENLSKLRTSTVFDFDGFLSLQVGGRMDIFPAISFDGDVSTPRTVNMVGIAAIITLVIGLFWALRFGYMRVRARRSRTLVR